MEDAKCNLSRNSLCYGKSMGGIGMAVSGWEVMHLALGVRLHVDGVTPHHVVLTRRDNGRTFSVLKRKFDMEYRRLE